MTAPLNLQKGQSPTRPPLFDGQFYSCWNIETSNYLMTEDIKVWNIICKGLYVLTMKTKDEDVTKVVPKTGQ